MNYTHEDAEEALQATIDDFREDLYLIAVVVVADYGVKARTLQRRLQEHKLLWTRSINNKTLNSTQEQALFKNIQRLNEINMSPISKMLRNNVNYILRCHD